MKTAGAHPTSSEATARAGRNSFYAGGRLQPKDVTQSMLRRSIRGAQFRPMEADSSRGVRRVAILGLTRDGRAFRPSDWAERLAGAMSSFRPPGAVAARPIGYSPLCVPRLVEGVRAVVVSEELRGVEPMAWDFVMNFARDNDLRLVELGQGP
jgi:hypothetical protein